MTLVEEMEQLRNALSLRRKRYMVFCYSQYYPRGGESDVIGVFESLDEVKAAALKEDEEYRDILDMDTGDWITV